MQKIEMPIPWKLSTNAVYAGIHWSKRKKHADVYHRAFLPWKGKVKIHSFPVQIHYFFTFKSRPLDSTNCCYMTKLLEDSMVIHKILPDDSPSFVAASHVYSRKGAEDTITIGIC